MKKNILMTTETSRLKVSPTPSQTGQQYDKLISKVNK